MLVEMGKALPTLDNAFLQLKYNFFNYFSADHAFSLDNSVSIFRNIYFDDTLIIL